MQVSTSQGSSWQVSCWFYWDEYWWQLSKITSEASAKVHNFQRVLIQMLHLVLRLPFRLPYLEWDGETVVCREMALYAKIPVWVSVGRFATFSKLPPLYDPTLFPASSFLNPSCLSCSSSISFPICIFTCPCNLAFSTFFHRPFLSFTLKISSSVFSCLYSRLLFFTRPVRLCLFFPLLPF